MSHNPGTPIWVENDEYDEIMDHLERIRKRKEADEIIPEGLKPGDLWDSKTGKIIGNINDPQHHPTNIAKRMAEAFYESFFWGGEK